MLKEILAREIVGLKEDELLAFVNCWDVNKELSRNEVLYSSNDTNKNIYFIETGSLKVYYTIEDKEVIMSFGYKNTFLLDLQSIFSEMNAGFNVSAIKACKLIGIKKDTFYNALENNPTIARYWQKCLEGMLLRDMEREIDLMTKAPETRYQRLLDRYPDLFQNIPHKYIASYLRMTPETLSRLKNS